VRSYCVIWIFEERNCLWMCSGRRKKCSRWSINAATISQNFR